MSTFAGEVEVTVVPDTSGFADKLRTKIDPAAAAAGERIGRQMGQSIAAKVADGIRSGIDRANATAAGARAGTQFGRAFAASANTQIRGVLRDQSVKVTVDMTAARAEVERFRQSVRSMPDIRLRLDSGNVPRTIAKIRTQLEQIGNKYVTIDVDVESALVNLARVRDRLREIGALRPTVRVDADTAAAAAQLAAIQRQIAALRGSTVNVGVNTGSSRAAMQNLIALALALSPALIGVGAAGVTAMAGITAAAVSAAGGIGVLALAVVPVIGAYQALGKAQTQSGKASDTGASKAIALANANDSLKQAVQGVARAKRDAADAAAQSDQKIADSERDVEEAVRASIRTQNDGTQRIVEAKRRLAEQVQRAADVQVQADRRIADAERSLASAQRDVLRAQEDLNEARGLAARDAEDLASRVTGGRLDERDAVFDLADAEAELAAASAEDRARAELAHDRAVQRLADIRRENARLAQEQADAAQAGVEGSDRVTDARNALAEAERRAADAARAAAEAAVEAAKDRVDAAQGIDDAEHAVAVAVLESAEQQRQAALKVIEARRGLSEAVLADQAQQVTSAEAIAAAQQQVIQAQRGVQSASMSAGAAASSAADDALRKFAALTPEGQRFVLFLRGEFIPAVKELSAPAQTGLLPGLQDGLRALIPLMPTFSGLIGAVAEAMGTLFRQAGQALQGPFWTKFFGFLQSTAGPNLLIFGRTIGQVIEAFAALGIAFQPLADQFGKGLLGLTTRFANFAKGAQDNPAFQRFLAYVLEAGPQVVATFGSIFNAIGNIIQALAPMSPVVLAVVKGFSDFIAILPPGVLEAIILALGGMWIAMRALAVIVPIVNTVVAVLNGTLALNPVTIVVLALVALGAALVAAYQHSETFRAVVDAVWAAVKTAIVTAWTDYIMPALQAMWGFIQDTLIPIFMWLWQNVIVPVWQGIYMAVQAAWGLIKVVFQAVVGFVRDTLIPIFQTYLWPVIKLVWDLIRVAIEIAWGVIQVAFKAVVWYVQNVLGPVFSWLYEKIIKPVWDRISAAISFVWERGIKPVFEALGNFIEKNVAPAFSTGVAAIKTAWDRLIEVAKVPVHFMVNTVINEGIIGTWNRIASWFKVDTVEPVKLPKGFATGGYLQGPGTGTSDSIMARVSNGEYIVRAAAVRKLGPDFLDQINQADKYDIFGDSGTLGIRPRYADGGLIDKVKAWLPSVDPKPYVWGGVGPGGYDCSGLTGEVWARLTNHPSYRRYMTTLSNFESMGFAPGQGAYTIGVSPSHMAGNLAGLAFEAASSASGIKVGGAAKPVGSFPRQFHLASMGGTTGDASGAGLSLGDPVGSVRAMLAKVLAGLKKITDSPWGELVAALPKQAADAMMDRLSSIWQAVIPGLVGGGLVAFDNGGYLPTGLSTIYNGTGRPEPVFTDQQWQTLRTRAGYDMPPVTVNVTNPVPEPASESTTRVMRRLAAAGPRG